MCAERKEHREEVLGPSSWAGYTSSWAEFLGRVLGPDTPDITHYKPKEKNTENKFLSRVLGPSSWAGYTRHHTSQAERKEHREEVLGPSSWAEFLGRMYV